MSDTVGLGESVDTAQHLRQKASGTYLSGRRPELFAAPRFEGDSDKALVEIHVDAAFVSPNRMTGVECNLILRNDAKYLSESIDEEVIEALVSDMGEKIFASPHEARIPARLKRQQKALGGVKYDAGRKMPVCGAIEAPGCIQRIDPKVARLGVS